MKSNRIFAPLSAILPVLVLFLAFTYPADAMLITFESITTSVTQGTPTVDPDNGRTYENDSEVITSFSAAGTTYEPVLGYDNINFTLKSSPNPTRVWYERNNIGSPTGYTGSALADLDDMFDNPLQINFGSDDTFVKTLDLIEFFSPRAVLIKSVDALTKAGLSVIERGANDTNFRVRAIISLDPNNQPLTYSAYRNVTSSDPFGGGVQNVNHDLWDSTRTDGVGPFDQFETGPRNQQIGGFILTFDEFGLSVGSRVYGYELSPLGGSTPGLDLLPGAASFAATDLNFNDLAVIPEPSTIALIGLVGLLLLFKNRTVIGYRRT